MALPAGSHLGEYEIIAPIGAGGMGEVYRARDSRLEREVAIKVLPADVVEAGDQQAMARFEREARAIAALSHPNILDIHQFGSDRGVAYIVTELLEGESLRERIVRGPLPWRRAIEIATQICDGLAAAHSHGVVHRDLKPDNVFLTRGGRVKILDFGLARVASRFPISDSGSTDFRTGTGTVMGTLPYMAPERLRGEDSGAGVDLFALGCLLHEMLTGRSPFARSSESDTITAILRDDPPEVSGAPPQLVAIVNRCLAKEKDQRFQSARDLEFDLRQLSGRAGTRVRISRRHAAIAAAILAAGTIAFILFNRERFALSGRTRKAAITGGPQRNVRLTQLTFAQGVEQFPAWSPDGTRIVFSGESGRRRKLYVKSLAEASETPLTRGEADEIQPAWSPDGRTILFVRATDTATRLEPGDVFGQYDFGEIWSINLESGTETKLISQAFNPAWSPDGRQIAFDASWSGPRRIWISDARGHNAQQATTDSSEAMVHVRPRWSPDGSKIVFQNIERTRFDIRVADLSTKQLYWITNDVVPDLNPLWSPSGQFVYFSSARGGGYNVWRAGGGFNGRTLGQAEQITTGAGQDVDLAFAPDGRIAFATLRQNADLWRLPVAPDGTPTGLPEEVVATTREDSRGAWSPDGRSIAFNSDRGGNMNIWIRSLADGQERQLTNGPGGDYQANWSPDTSHIAFFSTRAGSNDIWEVAVDSGRLQRLTHDGSAESNPFYSPDGRHIAYFSDADGRLELWVMNSDGTAERQLTRGGVSGHYVRWARDGSGIYFRSVSEGSLRTMLVPLSGGEPRSTAEVMGGSHMSFSADGKRIMDVVRHKVLWVSPLDKGKPRPVFEFPDPQVRIDYPSWSPDGRWVLFDRFRPEGGDIWLLEGFE